MDTDSRPQVSAFIWPFDHVPFGHLPARARDYPASACLCDSAMNAVPARSVSICVHLWPCPFRTALIRLDPRPIPGPAFVPFASFAVTAPAPCAVRSTRQPRRRVDWSAHGGECAVHSRPWTAHSRPRFKRGVECAESGPRPPRACGRAAWPCPRPGASLTRAQTAGAWSGRPPPPARSPARSRSAGSWSRCRARRSRC